MYYLALEISDPRAKGAKTLKMFLYKYQVLRL